MKKKITSIHLTAMTQNESFEFHTSIYSYFKECNMLELSAAEDNYRYAIGKYDEALKQIRLSDKTIRLAVLDNLRDRIYVGFVATNRAALLHFDADVVSAAYSVSLVIKDYGNPVDASYPAETSVIYNLCQDLQSAAYSQQVDTAGLTEWVVQLKKANEDFEEMFNERSDDQSVLVAGLAKTRRQELEASYNILMLVSEVALLVPDCALQAYVDRINKQIATYKTLIAARATRNATKRKKKEDGNDSDDNNNGEGPIEI